MPDERSTRDIITIANTSPEIFTQELENEIGIPSEIVINLWHATRRYRENPSEENEQQFLKQLKKTESHAVKVLGESIYKELGSQPYIKESSSRNPSRYAAWLMVGVGVLALVVIAFAAVIFVYQRLSQPLVTSSLSTNVLPTTTVLSTQQFFVSTMQPTANLHPTLPPEISLISTPLPTIQLPTSTLVSTSSDSVLLVSSVRPFYVDRAEVTNSQFLEFLKKNPDPIIRDCSSTDPQPQGCWFYSYSIGLLTKDRWGSIQKDGLAYSIPAEEANQPVRGVTSYGADEYCRARGTGFHVPSAEEWASINLTKGYVQTDGLYEWATDTYVKDMTPYPNERVIMDGIIPDHYTYSGSDWRIGFRCMWDSSP